MRVREKKINERNFVAGLIQKNCSGQSIEIYYILLIFFFLNKLINFYKLLEYKNKQQKLINLNYEDASNICLQVSLQNGTMSFFDNYLICLQISRMIYLLYQVFCYFTCIIRSDLILFHQMEVLFITNGKFEKNKNQVKGDFFVDFICFLIKRKSYKNEFFN